MASLSSQMSLHIPAVAMLSPRMPSGTSFMSDDPSIIESPNQKAGSPSPMASSGATHPQQSPQASSTPPRASPQGLSTQSMRLPSARSVGSPRVTYFHTQHTYHGASGEPIPTSGIGVVVQRNGSPTLHHSLVSAADAERLVLQFEQQRQNGDHQAGASWLLHPSRAETVTAAEARVAESNRQQQQLQQEQELTQRSALEELHRAKRAAFHASCHNYNYIRARQRRHQNDRPVDVVTPTASSTTPDVTLGGPVFKARALSEYQTRVAHDDHLPTPLLPRDPRVTSMFTPLRSGTSEGTPLHIRSVLPRPGTAPMTRRAACMSTRRVLAHPTKVPQLQDTFRTHDPDVLMPITTTTSRGRRGTHTAAVSTAGDDDADAGLPLSATMRGRGLRRGRKGRRRRHAQHRSTGNLQPQRAGGRRHGAGDKCGGGGGGCGGGGAAHHARHLSHPLSHQQRQRQRQGQRQRQYQDGRHGSGRSAFPASPMGSFAFTRGSSDAGSQFSARGGTETVGAGTMSVWDSCLDSPMLPSQGRHSRHGPSVGTPTTEGYSHHREQAMGAGLHPSHTAPAGLSAWRPGPQLPGAPASMHTSTGSHGARSTRGDSRGAGQGEPSVHASSSRAGRQEVGSGDKQAKHTRAVSLSNTALRGVGEAAIARWLPEVAPGQALSFPGDVHPKSAAVVTPWNPNYESAVERVVGDVNERVTDMIARVKHQRRYRLQGYRDRILWNAVRRQSMKQGGLGDHATHIEKLEMRLPTHTATSWGFTDSSFDLMTPMRGDPMDSPYMSSRWDSGDEQ